MGLNVWVGMLANEKREDPDSYAGTKDLFDRLSKALINAALKPHIEPEELSEAESFSCQMFGYSGLHHLRLLAAHVCFKKPLYQPTRTLPEERHPLVAEYYRLSDPSRDRTLPFEHLMQHSDCDGFYVPQDFPAVVVEKKLNVGQVIGSSVRLLEECRELAHTLALPLSLDIDGKEIWDATDKPGAGTSKWQQYGVESFTCLRLIRACEASVRTGAALVFC